MDQQNPRGFKRGRRMSKIVRNQNEPVGFSLGSTPEGDRLLLEVKPDSLAFRSGLRAGDVLTAINGVDLRPKSHEEIVQMIAQGRDLNFEFLRDGVAQSSQGAHQQRPPSSVPQQEPLGITVVTGAAFGDRTGVTRVEPNSPGERAGLQVGDILTSINGVDVTSKSHDKILELLKSTSSEELALGVQRGQEALKASASSAMLLDLGIVIERTTEGYIQVIEVFVNGAGEHAGLIAGDLILECDGESLLKIKFKRAVEILRATKASDAVANLITCGQPQLRQVVRGYQSRKPTSETPKFYEIRLQRAPVDNGNLEPLSMGIISEAQGSRSHVVSTVVEGGAAHRAGIMMQDKLVMINGEVVVHLNHSRVLDMLKNCGTIVVLGIEREKSLPPPPMKSRVNAPRTVLETANFIEMEI